MRGRHENLELPGWTFEVDEASAGVFEVVGLHTSGRSLRLVGTDPASLVDERVARSLASASKSERRQEGGWSTANGRDSGEFGAGHRPTQ